MDDGTMSAPVIGVCMKSLEAMEGFVGSEPRSSLLGSRYIEAISRAGGVPWPIPCLPDEPRLLSSIFERLDGLLLPGGSDIQPSLYQEVPHATTDPGDPDRDIAEMTLVEWAQAVGMPVLGICRGMQMLNLVRGGTLTQDLARLMPGTLMHDYFPKRGYARDLLVHEVRTAPGSMLRDLLGPGPVRVNSLHHQAIDKLGNDLVATALSPDGVIEGIEDCGQPFFVGVQWHPEELLADPTMRGLLETFVRYASARTGRDRSLSTSRLAAAG